MRVKGNELVAEIMICLPKTTIDLYQQPKVVTTRICNVAVRGTTTGCKWDNNLFFLNSHTETNYRIYIKEIGDKRCLFRSTASSSDLYHTYGDFGTRS